MVDKNVLWNETPNIFVAFLDIMGFKDRVFREEHKDVKKMLESLRPTIEDIEKEAKKRLQGQIPLQEKNKAEKSTSSHIFHVSFSDSIILFSNDHSDESAMEIIINAAVVLSEAIKNEIPMKGAIAFGEMTVDIQNSLYFGKPLIDAYELQKELQLYGVVLHHTAERRLRELKEENILGSLFAGNYSVPMKSGIINHHIISWMLFSENPIISVEKLYNKVSGSPRLYVDNTIKFVRWIEEEIAKPKEKNI
jgi:hypothetical protein